MSEKLHTVSAAWAKRAHIDAAKYKRMYARSVKDPDAFWRAEGQRISWFKPYTKVKNTSFAPGHVKIEWYREIGRASCRERVCYPV